MSTTEKTTLHMPGRTLPESNSLQRGQLVIVDGKWHGEITETMIGDGSFYRVEVDCDKPKHEFWTVKYERMEVLKDVVKIIVPSPKNDADTLMSEFLASEAKQRAEILATPVRTTRELLPEHRATAFVAGLQEARINALETALRAVCDSAGQLCRVLDLPDAIAVKELRTVVESATKLLA